jgi:hypothetical protein
MLKLKTAKGRVFFQVFAHNTIKNLGGMTIMHQDYRLNGPPSSELRDDIIGKCKSFDLDGVGYTFDSLEFHDNAILVVMAEKQNGKQ